LELFNLVITIFPEAKTKTLVLKGCPTIYKILQQLLVMNKKNGVKVMGCSGYEKTVCIYTYKLSGR
jgi:hypothetical protein